ncbi:hypothetical protein BX666DRAFT_1833272, partial [Dichotomocladium elegans]
ARVSTMSPTRMFFRSSQKITSMAHARAVFKALGQYGDLVEYKFNRCPETHQYMNFGFVTFKNREAAQKAAAKKFIKVESDLFDKPCDIKIEQA